MLDLVGRKADGWLPSLTYLEPGGLARGNARIDRSAIAAGRDPAAIRRLLNVGPDQTVEDLARMSLEDGVGTYILWADDEAAIRRFAGEVAPAVRELVAPAGTGEGADPGRPRRSPRRRPRARPSTSASA